MCFNKLTTQCKKQSRAAVCPRFREWPRGFFGELSAANEGMRHLCSFKQEGDIRGLGQSEGAPSGPWTAPRQATLAGRPGQAYLDGGKIFAGPPAKAPARRRFFGPGPSPFHL